MSKQAVTDRVYGEVPGVLEGMEFANRAAVAQAGVHKPLVAGICGGANRPAESIVLSGGYEDDWDDGDTIVYTGHGGNDPATGRQIAAQVLTGGNMALVKNLLYGVPVRVVRGARHLSLHAPANGYRYDGLYRVTDYWHEIGKSGYRIWRFRLRKLTVEAGVSDAVPCRVRDEAEPYAVEVATPRNTVQVARIVRNSQAAQAVKEMHRFHCQVCGTVLQTPGGPYAEAAHIRPLGAPHNGPDHAGNLLCLCPNHHALFDFGAWTLTDDLLLDGTELSGQPLRIVSGHALSRNCIRYHREHIAAPPDEL